jgi:phage gpG-like protein
MNQLEIKVQASKDYLRIDTYDEKKAARLGEAIAGKNILQREVKMIADMIRESIIQNLRQGKRYDTRANVKELALRTRLRKGHGQPFFETGRLFKGVLLKKVGRGYVIYLSNKRYPKKPIEIGGHPGYRRGKSRQPTVADVGKYLQEGHSNLPARPFFGINKKNLKLIIKQVLGKTRGNQYFKQSEGNSLSL